MQVLKEPKRRRTWSGLEEQGGQVGSPGGAQSSSTQTLSSHQHKALGSPCFSHLRRQRVSTMYSRSLILICLCLQMPILASGALQDQGPCKPKEAILDAKNNPFCSSWHHQDVESIRRMCSQSPGSQVVPLCKDGKGSPEKAMEYTAQPAIKEPLMCNGSVILIFYNESGQYFCMSQNVNSTNEAVNKQKGEDATPTLDHTEHGKTVILPVLPATALPILLISILSYKMRNKLRNWCKNRSSKSQPRPCHRTSQAIQPPYVPAPSTDPEDDDLHSVAIHGNTDTATATADIHDAVPGETSANPTENPHPSGTATVDTFLTADSESANACDSEAHDSAYSDSYDSASLGAEACGSDVASFLAAEVKNKLLSKYDSQKQVEMQVFTLNRQIYNPEYC
ncbi:uncharacterized protein [Desmodus rotundus]|uniref:uncharacterized protein n=1 Tax=Desmodus rotundus TaxID=9430 RepID=UPI0023810BD5|nr:uncharacterized protein LOC128781132 [Desmodus rotundus]